ncbi:arylsulfatase [Yinghuangia aomiensis]|uniref:Arylsulfatase n=1 Tax=Yinghuangia aomiensis TaxID=676205 RepID=A0ABP9I7V4_9ACTN
MARALTGRRIADSHPGFVAYPKPPAGAPNVVVIVLDDVGFAQLGCFGGGIDTPNIDALAMGGLRFNRFHVTAVCSPTRACLMTGRNHHAVGMGMISEMPLGFPGYNARIPKSAAMLPRILRDNGYNTFAVGKWHLAPGGELSASGPMDRWPIAQGFDRFYGYLGAETSQWHPELVRDNTFIDQPRTAADGYHLTEDLADQAIRMILDQRQATPDKPFFCYFATGAAHSPHQVPAAWSDAYRGRFDDGWEAFRRDAFARQLSEGVVPDGTHLTERPSWVPEWASLTAEERRLYARYMEVFAGFMSHADAQIGRVIDFLASRGDLDNTLVLLLSDNGASAEGGPTGTLHASQVTLRGEAEDPVTAMARIEEIGGLRTDNHYPWGWAWAGNTPLRLWKRYSWLGGVRTPMIAHWPARIPDPGSVRNQFCHAVDVFATVLDAVGAEVPGAVDGVTQQPVDGASLLPALLDPEAPSLRRTQYFETFGSRAIYHDGWKATTDRVLPMFGEQERIPGSHDLDDDRWSLFHLDADFSEAHDLADGHPDKVVELNDVWWMEAGRNGVLPLFEGMASMLATHPGEYSPPQRAEYQPGGGPVKSGQLPPMAAGFDLTADIGTPDRAPVEGVLCAQGDAHCGWTLYLLEGRPTVWFTIFGEHVVLRSSDPIQAEKHTVAVSYRPVDGGSVVLSLDGKPVAEAVLPSGPPLATQAIFGSPMTFGGDPGLPVTEDYEAPFLFTGTLTQVAIESHAVPVPPPTDEALRAGLRAD